MTWLTPLFTASIGTRVTADHDVPVASREWLMTMSFDLQLLRKRQSAHATYTVPAPSTSADGRGPSRRLPAAALWRTVAIVVTPLHETPPFVELKAPIAVSLAFAVGTM